MFFFLKTVYFFAIKLIASCLRNKDQDTVLNQVRLSSVSGSFENNSLMTINVEGVGEDDISFIHWGTN